MKRFIKSTFLGLAALLLGLVLFAVSPPAANAQGEYDEIADYGALVQWQDDNPAGGTITLADNIEIDDYIGLTNVHINAGDFGFIVRGKLGLYEDVKIIGSGADNPLVRVCEGGTLHLVGTNIFIVNGTGGAALHFEEASNLLEDDTSRLYLRAEGLNSVAIYTQSPLKFKRCTLEAGTGAGLITATEPVRLYLSYVEAQGPVAFSPHITLDTCLVSPTVTGGNIIRRKITKVSAPQVFFFAAGTQTQGYFMGTKVRCILTLSAEGEEDTGETANIEFDDALVNYDKPGEYKMPGVLAPPHDAFYALDILNEACPVETAVTVYDPGIPFYYTSYRWGGMLALCYYYTGAHEALTFWRSDDGGESWQVYWRPGDEGSEKFAVEYDDDGITMIFLDPAELIEPALFVFEVGTGKGSEVLYVDSSVIINCGYGGDRDSGDRILLPWEFFFNNPNDDDNHDDDGGNDGGNNGGGNNYTGGKAGSPPGEGEGGGSQGAGSSAGLGSTGKSGNLDDTLRTSRQNSGSEPEANVATADRPVSNPVDANSDLSPATAVVEYENERAIAISGKRLEALMLANAQMVPFARQDIQVWIPTGLLASMQLADTDIFTLQIEKAVQSEVSIMFFINDRILREPFSEAFLVGIPWAQTDEIMICTNSSGTAIPFEYDKQNGLLILTLFECGTYNIGVKPGGIGIDAAKNDDTSIHGISFGDMGAPIDENAAPSYAPIAILAVGAAGTGGAGSLIYSLQKRRLMRKRRLKGAR